MPRCHFHLRAEGTTHRDMSGSECSDLAAAHSHAEAVASELMRNCHHGTKLWSLRVEDEEARHVFDLFFADVADNDELSAEAQAVARQTSRRLATLIDTASSANETMTQSAALLARARGKPQLAYARKTK
jgi:hypothetical protein